MVIAVEDSDLLTSLRRAGSRLTAGEQQILALCASGWSAAAVAESMDLTPEAMDRSLASIIRRVGARSKIEAVLMAVRNGLIDLPTEPGHATSRRRDHRASA